MYNSWLKINYYKSKFAFEILEEFRSLQQSFVIRSDYEVNMTIF